MAIHNKNIIVDNLLLRYYFFNPKGAKKTLLFLHGWGVDSTFWFKTVDKLILKKYSIYLLDLPGFGKSQLPNTTFNVNDYKNIVIKFLNKLDLKKISLIGHSFGGRITIKLASENPDFLEKIVLVDTAGITTASKLKKILGILSKITNPIFRLGFMQPLRKRFYFLIGSEYLENTRLSEIFSKVVSENLVNLVVKIKKPTLILWGKKDIVTPLYYGDLIRKLIPGSRLSVFEKSGHFPFIDEPGKFVDELNKFL